MTDIVLPDELEKNYFVNVRQFMNGAIEAVVKVVRPLKQEAIDAAMKGASYATACAEKGESSRSGFTTFSNSPDEIDEVTRKRNHNRAVRRAKQNVRWLCKSMAADRLFTLTYRENVVDRIKVRENFREFLRLIRYGFKVKHADGSVTRYPALADWQYVAVLEKQERGAYHIHCAVKGFQKIKTLRAAWYRAIGGQGDEQGAATPGQVDVTSPDKRWGGRSREWKTAKLAGYLTKYLEKTFDETSAEKRRYWHSKQIEVAEKRVYWVGGHNVIEAIRDTLRLLRSNYGMAPGFFMWLSDSEDAVWFSGEVGELEIPF